MAALVALLRSAVCFSSAAAQEHPGRGETQEYYSTCSHMVAGTQIQPISRTEQILLDTGLENDIEDATKVDRFMYQFFVL